MQRRGPQLPLASHQRDSDSEQRCALLRPRFCLPLLFLDKQRTAARAMRVVDESVFWTKSAIMSVLPLLQHELRRLP